jgi:hypothetical protein
MGYAIIACCCEENYLHNVRRAINDIKMNYQPFKIQKIQSQEAKKNINLTITKIQTCFECDKLHPDWYELLDNEYTFKICVNDFKETEECYCYSYYGWDNYCPQNH